MSPPHRLLACGLVLLSGAACSPSHRRAPAAAGEEPADTGAAGEDVPPAETGHDATAPDPDVGGVDAGDPGDALHDTTADAGDVAPEDVGPAEPVEDCSPWLDVADEDLPAALHRRLHDDYRAIPVEDDLGGNPNRYTTARRHMFTAVEWFVPGPGAAGGVECVYTGRFFEVEPGTEPPHEVVNCEHTWPRARMEPDRESSLYHHQQSDIHALYPATAGVNGLRASHRFGEPVSGLNTEHEPARLGLDAAGHIVFQPRAERQGDVARASFYFSARWGRAIDDDEEAVLRRWSAEDPVDRREVARNDAVAELQGNRNPFIDCPGLAERVGDFADLPILDRDLPQP